MTRARAWTLTAVLTLLAVPALVAAQQPASARAPAGDELRPGDVVRLKIWREEQFSGDYAVDRSGVVVLPRIGALQVGGVPASELRTRILTELDRYLRNPSIDVVFLRRITIFGAVREAGLYPVDPTMTVLEALALAGGARPDGRIDRIKLLRNGVEVAEIRTTALQVSDLAVRSGDQLFVPEEGWFRRNTAIVGAVISAAVSLAITVIYITQS